MNMLDPNLMMLIGAWVFASVAIGLGSGFMIGRWHTLSNEPQKLQRDRERTLKALVGLLSSTNKLNSDVGEHNEALAEVQSDISRIKANGDVEQLQGRLLQNIHQMVESNRKLESELDVSRHQFEQQSIQLDETKREARTDALCELGNRKAFDESTEYKFSRMKSEGRSFALMLIDVDHFKRINDTFGHSSGDRVLISIGESLAQSVRPDDEVFRIGGDEFGILLDGVSAENVSAVGKRIRHDIELFEFNVDGLSESTVVTLSMGLTVAEAKDRAETLFVRADQSLYHSKEQGRNRLTIKNSNQTLEFASAEKKTAEVEFTSYKQFKEMAIASVDE